MHTVYQLSEDPKEGEGGDALVHFKGRDRKSQLLLQLTYKLIQLVRNNSGLLSTGEDLSGLKGQPRRS